VTLKMDASHFFLTLKHARKQHRAERNMFLLDMCDVATIPLNIANHKLFKEHFRKSAYPNVVKKRKQLPIDDDRTAQIVAAALHSAAKHMRGGENE
jgi:hypothetical protein